MLVLNLNKSYEFINYLYVPPKKALRNENILSQEYQCNFMDKS